MRDTLEYTREVQAGSDTKSSCGVWYTNMLNHLYTVRRTWGRWGADQCLFCENSTAVLSTDYHIACTLSIDVVCSCARVYTPR